MKTELTPDQIALKSQLKSGCPLINVELSGSLHGFTPLLTDYYAAKAEKVTQNYSGGMEL